jgi:hypothetical protein
MNTAIATTTTGTGLAPMAAYAGLVVSTPDDSFFDSQSSGGYLQAIKIEQKGRRDGVQAGNWSYGKDDNQVDLGESIEVLVWARRAKAIDISDEGNIIESYDSKSEEFQRILTTSKEKGMNGCLAGPSYLVQTRDGSFYEYFCTNASSQKESSKLNAVLPVVTADGMTPPKPIEIQSAFVEDKKKGYTYYVPRVGRCATPFDTSGFNVEATIAKIQEFINPPVKAIPDEAEDATNGRAT